MPVQVFDAAGGRSDWAAPQSLRHAANEGADIANVSFGSSDESTVMADAVSYARSRGRAEAGSCRHALALQVNDSESMT